MDQLDKKQAKGRVLHELREINPIPHLKTQRLRKEKKIERRGYRVTKTEGKGGFTRDLVGQNSDTE